MTVKRLTQIEFGTALWRAVVPPLLLLAIQAILLSLLLLYWIPANDSARRTEHSLFAIANFERLLLTIESSERSFDASHELEQLRPAVMAEEEIDPALDELSRAISGTPSQIEHLEALRELYGKWLTLQPLAAPRSATAPAARKPADVALREQAAAGMREQLERMLRAEATKTSGDYENQRRSTLAAVLAGVIFSALLGIALALINRRTFLQLSNNYKSALEEQVVGARQFSDLADALSQLIWITDADGHHSFYNRIWTDLTNEPPEKLLSQGWESLLHPEESDLIIARWRASFNSGQPFEAEYRMRRALDGTFRWFLCRATPVLDQFGRPLRWFGTCTDIENQKQAERQQEELLASERHARSDLIRNSRVKDEFLATLSHELRTPMTAILGWARLLRDKSVREKNLDRAIDAIDSNSKSQARLIDDLLDMSRIMSGKLTIKPGRVDLRQVVRAAVDSILPAATNKRITLAYTAETGNDLFLNGDAGRLQQVVWNLLSNSVKFTPAGGTVSTSLRRRADQARLVITDTGPGIDPRFLPHVFERFRQADGSTTRTHGGLGLGLAIVKNLVELHGGTVVATSEGLGRGATFTLEFPLIDPTMMITDLAPQSEELAQLRLNGKRVLVVDDDADTAFVLKMVLEQLGAEVIAENSAEAALARSAVGGFDLLISDIGMPVMDGYGLIHRIRQREADNAAKVGTLHVTHLPAIALTAFARAADQAMALDAGFDLHVGKPVGPDELRRAIARLLSSKA